MELFHWYNFIFAGPFALALLYFVGLISGLVSDGGDHDVEFGLGHGEVAADFGHDHEFEHDVEHPEHALEVAADPGLLRSVGDYFGFGKVPLSVLMMLSCLTWGLAGLWANKFFGGMSLPPWIFVWPSTGIALAVSLASTKYGGRVVARLMPKTTTFAVSKRGLVGKRAQARFPITDLSGSARLRDEHGTLHEVSCVTRAGEEPVPQGEFVYLTGYDSVKKVYTVRRSPFQTPALEERVAR